MGGQLTLAEHVHGDAILVLQVLGVVDQVDHVLAGGKAVGVVPIHGGGVLAVSAEERAAGGIEEGLDVPGTADLEGEVVDALAQILGHHGLHALHLVLGEHALVVVHEEGVGGEGNGVDKAILGGNGGDSACGVELTQAVQLVADGEQQALLGQLGHAAGGQLEDVGRGVGVGLQVCVGLVNAHLGDVKGEVVLGVGGGEGFAHLLHEFQLFGSGPDLQGHVLNLSFFTIGSAGSIGGSAGSIGGSAGRIAGVVGLLAAVPAAGGQAQHHDECKNQSKCFLHG